VEQKPVLHLGHRQNVVCRSSNSLALNRG